MARFIENRRPPRTDRCAIGGYQSIVLLFLGRDIDFPCHSPHAFYIAQQKRPLTITGLCYD